MSRQSEAEAYRHQPQTESERLAEAYKGVAPDKLVKAITRYWLRYNTAYLMAQTQSNHDYWQSRLDMYNEGCKWFIEQIKEG
jgi:hypothetical protein